jgi:hypothetical protein
LLTHEVKRIAHRYNDGCVGSCWFALIHAGVVTANRLSSPVFISSKLSFYQRRIAPLLLRTRSVPHCDRMTLHTKALDARSLGCHAQDRATKAVKTVRLSSHVARARLN